MLNLKKALPRPLSGQERLLRLLDEAGQFGLHVTLVFRDIEDELGISYSTLKRYLKALSEAEAIKYNLKFGVVFLNPAVFVYPEHTVQEVQLWHAQYKNFVSVA